mgnify:CR=1 FL=1
MPGMIIDHQLWWHGPQWLSQEPSNWPRSTIKPRQDNLPEQKTSMRLLTTSTKFSKFPILQKVVPYCPWFIWNSLTLPQDRKMDSLSVQELINALNYCIRIAQSKSPTLRKSRTFTNINLSTHPVRSRISIQYLTSKVSLKKVEDYTTLQFP